MKTRLFRPLLAAMLGLALAPAFAAQNSEVRAFWVAAWYPGFQTQQEVTRLIEDVRAANCNTIFLQVRKRGDAYFNGSPYEPRALTTTEFDPLAETIRQARDTAHGPRIEVHAWVVVYPIAHQEKNPQTGKMEDIETDPGHPFNRHRAWLSKTRSNQLLDGDTYRFDPAHPEVQQYLFNVAMDIISRYDVDGLQLDQKRVSMVRFCSYSQLALARV